MTSVLAEARVCALVLLCYVFYSSELHMHTLAVGMTEISVWCCVPFPALKASQRRTNRPFSTCLTKCRCIRTSGFHQVVQSHSFQHRGLGSILVECQVYSVIARVQGELLDQVLWMQAMACSIQCHNRAAITHPELHAHTFPPFLQHM